MNLYDVIIIGAGPSGLFAGIHCAVNDKDILLLEKNECAGKKLLLSGGGQCNITHDGDIKDFFNHYGEHGKFIRYGLSKFTNEDTLDFFRRQNMNFFVNEEGKIFPQTKKASHILNILLDSCKKRAVRIFYQSKVIFIAYENEVFKVQTNKDIFFSKQLIIATGGKSYPKTGSEGDGFAFAKKLGHYVEEPSPALTPLYIKNYPFTDLAGVSFEKIKVSVWRSERKIHSFVGDILFTHRGVSGPGILNHSRFIKENDIIKLHFISNMNEEAFRNYFMNQMDSNGRKQVRTWLKTFPIPKRLGDKLCQLFNISEELQCSNLNKELRNQLIQALTSFPLEVEKLGGFHIAMATKGGVSLKEIDPKTMESKRVKGLYFVGEVLDIDGDTGGYNIQAAFSTAVAAARDINHQY